MTDLCGLAARKDPLLREIAQQPGLTIIACYPRAVRNLFLAAGVELSPEIQIINQRSDSAQSSVDSIAASNPKTCCCNSDKKPSGQQTTMQQDSQSEWIPWFPVIDYELCTNCKQCLNFCLFGVFGTDDLGKILVKNPSNCKTNCPACARVCPRVAIIFPKHDADPINGAAVTDPEMNRQNSGVNLKNLAKSDIYESLRRRSASGKSRFAPAESSKAPTDSPASSSPQPEKDHQQSCASLANLASMQEKLGIPDEVINSLCSCDCSGKVEQSCQNSRPTNSEPQNSTACSCNCDTDSDKKNSGTSLDEKTATSVSSCDCDCQGNTPPENNCCG
ncbi:MAG: ferredoxin family protein [Sedimentisphaerales bacterium]|nr:ferredoxin family protein [Sedimentisphaerales bacterium]